MGNENNSKLGALERPFPAYNGDGQYIFISYAHRDAELVFREIEIFHSEGYNIWYDQGLTPGQEWDDEIAIALMNCSLLVVFISKNSMASKNVQDEIKMAINKDIDVVPIYLEQTELPPGLELRLSNKHAIFKYLASDEDYKSEYTKAFENARIKINAVPPSEFNFKYLNHLIQSGEDKLLLTDDISFCDEEFEFLQDGISIDVDNLIIDGGDHTIDAKNKGRIFDVSAQNVILKNITFKNANFEKWDGGAITVQRNATLKIESCKFENNSSASEGGAINNSGNLNIADSKFCGNDSKSRGGAIRNDDGATLTISNSQFENNSGVDGGSIVNYGEIQILHSHFDKNHAKDDGGAIVNYQKCIIKNSIFAYNSANCGDDIELNGGGALFNCEGEMTVDRTTFGANESRKTAGAIFNYYGEINVRQSLFEENSAELGAASLNNVGDGQVNVFNSKFDKSHEEEILTEDDEKVSCERCRFK